MANENIYFAKKDAKGTASVLLAKADTWVNSLTTTGYLEKLKDMWAAYHGAYFSDAGSGHQISFSGEQGELVNLPVNHLRNLATHIIIMTTSNRPSMEARAVNTDYKSLVQTKLANNILDYYLREKRLEKYLKNAVEYAVVLGAGYIKMEWNATSGEVYDYFEDEATGEPDPKRPIYEGDIEFSNLSPFDVVVDGTKEGQTHDWVLVRSYKNKFDLAVKYKEFEEKIVGLPTKSDLEKLRIGMSSLDEETDDVPVYEFYHKKTDSMPNGRYMLFLSDDIVLQDLGLPFRMIPVFRISAGDILGSPYGYTPLFDILPIQEGINMLYSTILSNQNAFGVQNIYVPRGADISVSQLAGGLNVIEGNAQAGKPEPLNLTNTPAELFKFLEMLEKTAETLSGVNSVARGNPEASLKTGAALALVQSMALQFMSGLQQSYVQLVEDVGSAIIKALQDYANVPRLIAIAGKSQRSEMREFSSKDISAISRVYVDVGNPLGRTIAGRMQLAEQMMQYQIIKNPNQLIEVMNTGRLDSLTDEIQDDLLLIRAENEKIMEGETPPVTIVDDHLQHIQEHRRVLADPDLRKDPDLVKRALDHIQMHINELRNGDPDLLMMLRQQPLQPSGPVPQPQQPPQQGQVGVQNMGGQELAGPGLPESGVNLPNVPQVDPSLLANPDMAPQPPVQ